MSTEPTDEQGSEAVAPGRKVSDAPAGKWHPPLERSRFGGTARRPERPPEDEPPVSRSDLSKGPQEVLEERTASINWSVLVISSVVIVAFSAWAILVPAAFP